VLRLVEGDVSLARQWVMLRKHVYAVRSDRQAKRRQELGISEPPIPNEALVKHGQGVGGQRRHARGDQLPALPPRSCRKNFNYGC
jgi:hypothetical protein